MPVWYPYALRNLATVGSIPADTFPARGVHFNRIFEEVRAIEATLGPDIAGSKTDLKTRLAVNMNDDGTLQKELLCEDDQSGGNAGSYRYSDAQWTDNTWGPLNPAMTLFVPLAYSAWDVPPVFIMTLSRAGTSGWYRDGLARQRIRAISEVGASVEFRKVDGVNIGSSQAGRLAWWSVSRDLMLWQEDVAWAMRPARTGS